MTNTTTPAAASGKTHELKTDPAVFAAVLAGTKTHEIRLNDRGFAVGDTLLLRETVSTGAEMAAGAPLAYSGRATTRTVSHIQTGYGLADSWCILSFAALANQPESEAPQAILQVMDGEFGEYWIDAEKATFDAANAEGITTRTVYTAPAAQPAPTAAPEQVAQGADEREAFEAWHRSKFATKHSTGQPTRDMHNGVYAEKYGPENQQQMWEAWQAAKSQPYEAAPLAREKLRALARRVYEQRHDVDDSAMDDLLDYLKGERAAPSLPAAAPAAGDELRAKCRALVQKWHKDAVDTGFATSEAAVELEEVLDAHQPAQEQAEPVARVSEAELRDIQSGVGGVPVRGSQWRDDQTIPLYAGAAPDQAAQHEASAEIDVRHEFEMYKSRLGEAANYIGDGLYGNHGVTDQANAFRAGVEVGLAASPVVRAHGEESEPMPPAEAAALIAKYEDIRQAHAGADEAKPLAHGHRDDHFLLVNARRIGMEPISRVRQMSNWVLAMELFATGSTSAHQICRDAGIDPDSCTTERAAIRAAQEGGAA